MRKGSAHLAGIERGQNYKPQPGNFLNDRRAISIFYSLFSIFTLLLLVGCGAPGEPTERKAPIPVAVTDLAAFQQGNDVVLTFTLPKESIEHKPLKQIPAIEIYRTFETLPPTAGGSGSAPDDSTLLVTIPPEMEQRFTDRNQFRYVDTLIAENFSQNSGKDAVYAVRTRTSSKKVSASSNLVSVAIQPAADPIADLKAEITREAIVLNWSAPQKTLVGGVPPITTYNIYRAEFDATKSAPANPPADSNGIEQKPAFIHIGDALGPEYRDLQIQFGKKYTYAVRSVVQYHQIRIESAESNIVSVERSDTFPPSAPEGLIAALIPAQDQTPAYLDLSWSISTDNDIVGYNIYRSEGTASPGTKLNSTLLLTPAFRDMNVLSGRHYFYTVTAVNRAGNESEKGAPVTGDVPERGTPAVNQPQ